MYVVCVCIIHGLCSPVPSRMEVNGAHSTQCMEEEEEETTPLSFTARPVYISGR